MGAVADLRTRVDQGLDTLRAGLASDGGDLQVTRCDADSGVEVVLALEPDACEDCLVSEELMKTMVENIVREAAPEVSDVVFVDPRAQRSDA